MTATRWTSVVGLALAVCAFVTPATSARTAAGAFIDPFTTVSTITSTVPRNGDVNPYGVAVAPVTMGKLVAGDVLVTNFNNRQNLQGTGKTIVEISPSGQTQVFASIHTGGLPGLCPGGIGLTTALVALKSGWVVVGSLPTTDGTSQTAKAGCLLILNPMGDVVETIFGAPINGPWDMTAADNGDTATLFVSNVLNGTVAASPSTVNQGTIVRIVLGTSDEMPQVHSETVIGQGFPERTDPAALVVGPTGLGLASDGTLYVANSVANRIASISDATTRMTAGLGHTVSKGGSLNDPLGLAMAPNGDILTTNGGDGNLVETTPAGAQVAVKTLDNTPLPPGLPGNGTLFGLAVTPSADGVYFVDDGSNTLNLLH